MATITISNKKLIKEIDYLYLTAFQSKQDRQKASIKSSVLRQAFSVKNNEIDSNKTKDYKRHMSVSIDTIKKWFNDRVNMYDYLKSKDENEAINSIVYFLDAAGLIDKKLQSELISSLSKELQQKISDRVT